MTPPVPRHLPAVLLALLLTLTACTGSTSSPRGDSGDQDARPELAAGTCWSAEQLPQSLGEGAFQDWVDKYARGQTKLGKSMRDDAAFSEEIDCAEPHALEVYNVVTLAPKLLEGVGEYADLLDPSTRVYAQVRDQVNQRCAAGSPYGKAQRKAGLKVQLGPALAKDSGLNVAWDPFPADLWAQGEHRFVCTLEQEEPGTRRYADLTTSKTPMSARVCLDQPGKVVPCRAPHQAEDIAEMVLNTAIESGGLNAKRAVRKGAKGRYVALSDREYARVDKVCNTFLRMVSTRPHGVSARAYPGSVDQWPTKSGTYVASCFALRPLVPPPKVKGTVFDR